MVYTSVAACSSVSKLVALRPRDLGGSISSYYPSYVDCFDLLTLVLLQAYLFIYNLDMLVAIEIYGDPSCSSEYVDHSC